MQNKALVIIDLQNDITQNYKEIICNVNNAISWAVDSGKYVVYIKHNSPLPFLRKFQAGTYGEELVADMNVVSQNIFKKTKANAMTSKAFADFIDKNEIEEFYIAGADAAACVKSTCCNMAKKGYKVHILSDCITSHNKRNIRKLLEYYSSKGCQIETLSDESGDTYAANRKNM